jgi:hypothetical protein
MIVLLRSRKLSLSLVVLFLASCVTLSGCAGEKGGQVRGKVLVKGEPTAMAEVALHPVSGSGQPIKGTTGGDGSFLLTGVPPGEYKVTVTSKMAGMNMGGIMPQQNMSPEEAKALAAKKGIKLAPGEGGGDMPSMAKPGGHPIPPQYTDVSKTPLTLTVTKGLNEPTFNLED